jgi:hypothetical protein
MAEIAREARRKKILENSQRRLDLLLGLNIFVRKSFKK